MRRALIPAIFFFGCSSEPKSCPAAQDASIAAEADASFPDASSADAGLTVQEIRYLYDAMRPLPRAASWQPCMDVELADLDNDGDLDVLLALEGPSNRLLTNDGTGVFTDSTPAVFGFSQRDSEEVAVADFNSDSILDILFVTEDGGGVNELYLSTGPLAYESAHPNLPGTGVSNGVDVGDVNADGFTDVVVANAGPDFLWLGDGAGNFTDVSTTALPRTDAISQEVELGDVDGDGDLDLIIANESADQLLINDDGIYSDESNDRLPAEDLITREADFGDIDGDGDLDLVFANTAFGPRAPLNRLLENDGTGHYTVKDTLADDDDSSLDADFIDLDDDGDLDILTSNTHTAEFGLVPAPWRSFANDGRGNFVESSTQMLPGAFEGFGLDAEAGDLDGDGLLDLYLCGRASLDRILFGVRE
jgi:hypothetical protein